MLKPGRPPADRLEAAPLLFAAGGPHDVAAVACELRAVDAERFRFGWGGPGGLTATLDFLEGKLSEADLLGPGNQVSLTDADINTTTMVYDVLNRLTQQTDPLNNSTTFAYDGAGRLTSSTDRDGRIRNVSYDALNREAGETWITSGSTVNLQTFTYDAAGNKLTAADYNGAYTMAYDALNRMTSDGQIAESACDHDHGRRDVDAGG